ncbi:MAG: hypothetical protein L0K24_10145 [Tetragenococcus koreensis]|nr:hypothetical protein [Tetragenococcus koreensis]
MRKHKRKLLALTIIVAVVSPLSLVWTAIISVTALEALILEWNDYCLEGR